MASSLGLRKLATHLKRGVSNQYVRLLRVCGETFIDEFRLARALTGAEPKRWKMGGAVPLRGDYLVTTSHGLFRLRGNEVTMVTPLPAFGAALLNGKLFLSSWSEHDAFILRSQQSIRESLEANSRISW